MKRLFITGGNGFIGKNLVEQFSQEYEVYAPGRQELNLLEEEPVKRYILDKKIDVIIHCANQNGSRNAKEDINLVLERNLRMFMHLVRCNEYVEKILYFGSGSEYDMRNYIPNMKEEYFDQHVPVDGSGFSKYIMAKFAFHISNLYDLRVFGCFGKYEDWEIRFISNAICKVLYDLPITIHQNVVFDYLFIEDLAKITKWFIEHTPKEKHYNITTGHTIDLVSIAHKVLEISKKSNLPIKVHHEGMKREYSGDNQRLLQEMKGFAFTNIDMAIQKLYDWYASNLNLIDIQLLYSDK